MTPLIFLKIMGLAVLEYACIHFYFIFAAVVNSTKENLLFH